MNRDQFDAFGDGKSTDEIQLEKAIEVIEKNGFRVARTAEDAKTLAIDAGYRVSDPLLVNDQIVTLKDLRNYFYMRLWTKFPERESYHVEGNWEKEMRIIRLFVESREKTGLNRFNAIQECVALIDIIFNHAEEFNFRKPIDLRVLGQGSAGWITQKASMILNEKLYKQRSDEVEKRIKEYEDGYDVDLDQKASLLDKLLSKMEANNGYEKGNG
jgi:hypothetical protein